MNEEKEFGFFVEGHRDSWSVSLPHSCDSWVIGEGKKADVLATLYRFIQEASEARVRLEKEETD